MTTLLLSAMAWRPLLDPLPIDRVWLLLLVPLAVAIAVVYKTIKLDDLAKLPRQAAVLSAQIVVFMLLAGVMVWLLVAVGT